MNADLDKSKNIKVTEQDQLFHGINYVVNVLCLLIFTTITKKIGNRPRPHNPCEDSPQPASVRWINLRGREGNKSMPSADTA